MTASLVALAIISGANCDRDQCFHGSTTVEKYALGLSGQQAWDEVNSIDYGSDVLLGYSRRRRDVNDNSPSQPTNTVIDAGKVIVMPPPGVAPKDVPQFGQPGGGAPPETDLYTAALAPEDSVPVAIFPPFSEQMTQPTKCVIFSELTDFEKDQKMIPRPQPFRVRLYIII